MAQSQDPVMREIKYVISKNKLKWHKVYSQDPQIVKQYLSQCSHLVPHKGVIYRLVAPSKENRNTLQLVIPQNYQMKALQVCHDEQGCKTLHSKV